MSKTATLHVHHAFCTFLCRPCETAARNDQILIWLEDGNGKAINFTLSLSLWTRTQPPLFSSDLTSLLSNNWVTWFNGKKVSKNAKSIFQRRFHWRHRCRMVRSLMFLDRDGHLHCRKREEKNGPTVSSWMQSWTGKLYMSILRLFLQYLRNHALLRSRNSATKATVRDVTVCFVEG